MILLASIGLADCYAASYTLAVTADHGSVQVTPDKSLYDEGEVVELIPKPETGYCFTGWTGDARGKRLVLNVTMNQNQAVVANFGTWQPAIGIPAPAFGISETHYMYASQSYDFGSGLESYKDAGNGPYTHYVDSTDTDATDTNNPYGSPGTPRLTVPRNLPAGSVVEIHNSASPNGFGDVLVDGVGTAAKPIFVRGVNLPRVTTDVEVGYYGNAQYLIVEGLSFMRGSVLGRKDGTTFTTSYIAIRGCDFQGDETLGGLGASSYTANAINNIVLYNNTVHDNGIWNPLEASGDQDIHGISAGAKTSDLWIVNNHMYHNSGDGLQINAGNITAQSSTHHIYVGANISHHNKQTGLWTKQAVDVIFSENEVYGHRSSSSSYGAGMGFQYAPERVWFLFNTIHDCEFGIGLSSDSGMGSGTESYFIGNLIYDIHYDPDYHDPPNYNPSTAWANAAIMTAGGVNRHFIGNTIHDVAAGINIPGGGSAYIADNVISNVGTQGESHVWIEDASGGFVWEVENNLVYQPGGTGRIRHYNTVYTASTVPGDKGSDNLDADPEFVVAGSDFRLEPTSPAGAAAKSSGTVQQVYDIFSQRYGIDIRKDIEGTSLTDPWDIGAHKSENRAPRLAAIGSQTATVGSLLSFSISATDADGDSVTYSASGLPTGASFSGATFSWTPTGGQVGTHDITFSASDGAVEDPEVVTVTVISDTNHAPVLATIGARSVGEGSSLSFAITATDVDGDSIAYSATGLPTGATFSSQTFSWTPGYTQEGPYDISFVASDGVAQDSEVVTVTVSNTNRAPVLATIGARSVDEGSSLSFAISASDADGGAITYSASPLPSGAVFSGQTFTWTPTYDQAGGFGITFAASDGSLEDSEAITMTVVGVNRAPVLDSIPNQSIDHSTLLTFGISATDPDSDTLSYSATGLPTGATLTGQTFNWTPAVSQAGTYQVTFTASDGQLNDSQAVTIAISDSAAPIVTNISPAADSVQAPLNSLVSLHIADAGIGVDASTVIIQLNSDTIYTGDTLEYSSAGGTCHRTGTSADYAYAYQSSHTFDFDQTLAVTVHAADLGDIAMSPYSYSFTTEMRAFGPNRSASWGPLDSDKGNPATVCDSLGKIWVVYHAGVVGRRDIYVSGMALDATIFSGPIQLTTDASDQSYPDIAVGSDDKLYIVWQDNRRGNWDIYARTSVDGVAWSSETRITDSSANQVVPVVAVGNQSPNTAYVAWQDDGAGQEDIYVASSSNGFLTNVVAPVTSDASNQITPDIAIDISNTVYLVWTDERNGSDDIYGADLATGPWTNVAVVTDAGNQHTPSLATEATGSVLHFAWVDDASGNSDIRYVSSDGMPSGPLAGVNLVDDTSGASQIAPTVAVTGSTGNGLEVFVCWQDWRNTTSTGADTDLYFVDVETGDETNILVGDGETGSSQGEPAMGVDRSGYPYVVWTDDRNTTAEIYYAGAMRTDSTALVSGTVTASSGGTFGPSSPAAVGDVSITIAAEACPYDVIVSISEMENPPSVSSEAVLVYEFGPSGLQFTEPVTITIPYAVADFPNGIPTPYWYDAQTGSLTQQGITAIETVEISETIRAVRFQTTHFTPYGLFDTGAGGGGSGGGGGGCALTPTGQQGDFAGFLLPYLTIAGAAIGWRWRDRSVRRRTMRRAHR